MMALSRREDEIKQFIWKKNSRSEESGSKKDVRNEPVFVSNSIYRRK